METFTDDFGFVVTQDDSGVWSRGGAGGGAGNSTGGFVGGAGGAGSVGRVIVVEW